MRVVARASTTRSTERPAGSNWDRRAGTSAGARSTVAASPTSDDPATFGSATTDPRTTATTAGAPGASAVFDVHVSTRPFNAHPGPLSMAVGKKPEGNVSVIVQPAAAVPGPVFVASMRKTTS